MLKLLRKSKSTADEITLALLRTLKIPVHSSTVKSTLEAHPEYPSLLAISDSLTEWNIPNNSYRILPEEYDPAELLFPVIAHTTNAGGQFILIHSISEGTVHYTDALLGSSQMPESIFLKLWDGILLHAEPTEKSGDKEFRDSKIKGNLDALRVPLAIAASFAVLLMLLTNAQPSSWLTTLFVVKFAGLAIAVLLLIQSIDANNPLIQNLCSLGGKNNCNAILKSEAAKINSWLTWSEVGFFYFAGSLLTLLLPATSAFASVATLLSYLSLLALPYTVYSISYQYRTGNWCLLCCGIQAVLWLEAVTFILSPFSFNDLSTNGAEIAIITAFAVGFMVPLAIWAFIKPFLLNASQVRPLKNQLKKFKYNSQLFNQVLTSQPRFAVPDKIMPILLGNPEAETVITMVSNPFCGPCAIVHKLLEGWLATRNDIQLKIVFSTANSDDDPRTQVSRHLSALSKLDNKATIELALNAWYESTRKDYADWALKYPVQLDNEQEEVTQHQKEWCDMADITFTPTILINGYKLPDPYRLEDIKYLIA